MVLFAALWGVAPVIAGTVGMGPAPAIEAVASPGPPPHASPRPAGPVWFAAGERHPARLAWDSPTHFPMASPWAQAEFWNDKLSIALADYELWRRAQHGEPVDYLSPMFRRSFDLEGLEPKDVSAQLTRELKDGARFHGRAGASLLNESWRRYSVELSTGISGSLHVPGAPFLLLFSPERGLQQGNALDFGDFRQRFRATTNLEVSHGRPLRPSWGLVRKGGFQRAAWGISLQYVLGHAMLDTRTRRGSLSLDENSPGMSLDAEMELTAAGMELRGSALDFNLQSPGALAAGHGAGIGGGVLLLGERQALAVEVRDLGAVHWPGAKRATVRIHRDSLFLYDFIDGLTLTELAQGEDTLRSAGGVTTPLPGRVSLNYARELPVGADSNGWVPAHLRWKAKIEQYLFQPPAFSYFPRVGAQTQFAWFGDLLAVTLGLDAGGAERIASSASIGIHSRFAGFVVSYKAVGTPYLHPKRGVFLGVGLQGRFGE